MKCQIKWIDKHGNATPDENDAVMMAHVHTLNYLEGVIRYDEAIQASYPICATHYAQVADKMRYPFGGWEFTPLPEEESK